MKILLTGASGFIGGHLLTQLTNNLGYDSVIALTNKEIPNTNCILYEKIQKFGLEKNYFDEITHIIHAGAFTPKDAQQANDIDRCFGNIEYTKELVSYDYKKLEKFINLSTLDVYEATSAVLSEKSKIQPVSLYGSSKLYCEAMVKAFTEQRNINCINLRIGHVYGPGEEKYKKVLPIGMKNILEGKPLELWGEGNDLRSFIFIQDVVQAIINSLEVSVQTMDINVVSGVSVSIKELLEKMIEVSGENIKINKRESNYEKRDLVFDNSLLLSTILEKETDLLEGLKIEYKYMKDKYENNIRS